MRKISKSPKGKDDAKGKDNSKAKSEGKSTKSGEKRVGRSVARDAAGIVRNATNFGQISDRDEAYNAFFASFGKKSITIAELAAKKVNPLYAGSNKSSDVGVINRMRKAGKLTASADGTSIQLTPDAYAVGLASLKKARTPSLNT